MGCCQPRGRRVLPSPGSCYCLGVDSAATRKGILLSLAAALSAAAFLIPYKAAGEGASRDAVVMAMLAAAAALNTLLILGDRLRAPRATPAPRRSPRLTLLLSLALAAFTALGNRASAEALVYIGPGLTSVVQQTQILFVAAAAALLLGERITARFALGALIALAGFAVMRLPGGMTGHTAGAGTALAVTGMLWAVVSAVSFGSMHVITRKFIHRIDPVPVNALRLWFSAAMLACWPSSLTGLDRLDARTWALAGAAALVGPFFGRIALMYALRHISASQSTLLNLTSPVFAFGLGFLAFGTAPTTLELAGGTLILAGTALPVLALAGGARPG